MPIGCQTYPVRKSISTDFAGTMKGLRAAGFTQIELCSPYGYADFYSLQQYKPQELRRMLSDWGLGCISAHWAPTELFQKADESISYAKEFGMTQMAIAALGPFRPKSPQTVDDVKRYVEPFNAFAEKAHAAGIVALLHNEGFVSERIDGKPVYDMMIAELNPATTRLQFQVSTLQQGYDPVTYFNKYPGRFLSMHCQDWVKDSSTKSAFHRCELPVSMFRHGDHLRFAWLTLHGCAFDEAVDIVREGIRRFAGHHGVGHIYHETVTTAWVHLLATHRERTFEEFLTAND